MRVRTERLTAWRFLVEKTQLWTYFFHFATWHFFGHFFAKTLLWSIFIRWFSNWQLRSLSVHQLDYVLMMKWSTRICNLQSTINKWLTSHDQSVDMWPLLTREVTWFFNLAHQFFRKFLCCIHSLHDII